MTPAQPTPQTPRRTSVTESNLPEPASDSWDIEAIIAEAKPTERSCRVCLDGELRGRFDDLEAQLATVVQAGRREESLAAAGEAQRLAQQIEDLRTEMASKSRRFVFKAIGVKWNALVEKYADDQGKLPPEFFAVAVATCAISPKMTADQAQRLFDQLAQGDIDLLYITARDANKVGSAAIPKSRLASEILARRESSPN
jgi:hypothetical protein